MLLVFFILILGTRGDVVSISLVMQGSDYINISGLSFLEVDQYDLGDVFLSPCREGTFSDDHSGICRDCTACASNQYEKKYCLSFQNRQCKNCTVCKDREQETCACGVRTNDCYIGNRVCTPLATQVVNLTFEIRFQQPISQLQFKFVESGMMSGFVMFLSDYLEVPDTSITLEGVHKAAGTELLYYVTFTLDDVYKKSSLDKLAAFDTQKVKEGLAYTFGKQGRRLLTTLPGIDGGNPVTQCKLTSSCPQFFQLVVDPNNPCNSSCVPRACPPGYTGDYGDCTACVNGTFKPFEGNDTCIACPSGFTTPTEASTSYDQCNVKIQIQASQASQPPSTTPLPGSNSGLSLTSTASSVSDTSKRTSTPRQVTTAAAGPARTTSSAPKTTMPVTTAASVEAPKTTSAPASASKPGSSSGVSGNATGSFVFPESYLELRAELIEAYRALVDVAVIIMGGVVMLAVIFAQVYLIRIGCLPPPDYTARRLIPMRINMRPN